MAAEYEYRLDRGIGGTVAPSGGILARVEFTSDRRGEERRGDPSLKTIVPICVDAERALSRKAA